MGFIHDTDGDEFRGITLEMRRESIVLGFDDALHPEDESRRTFVEIGLADIPALRLVLDMAELPRLPKGWHWERDAGRWQARSSDNVIVGYDADRQVVALDSDGDYRSAPTNVAALVVTVNS